MAAMRDYVIGAALTATLLFLGCSLYSIGT